MAVRSNQSLIKDRYGMTNRIYAIHGAFSSPRVFNYLRFRFKKEHEWKFLDYQDQTGGLDSIIKNVEDQSEPAHVVGHSMGGLIALSMIDLTWVKSVTTISTPLGGIDINILQSYLSRSGFMNDISSHSSFINGMKNIRTEKPVQHLISTVGFNPWLYEPNDGVVTLRSQRAVALGPVHEIDANHSEILMTEQTVKVLGDFWNQ